MQALLEEFTLGFDQLSFEQFSRRLTTPEGLFCFILLVYMELVLGTIVMLSARSDAVKSDALDWGSAPVEVVGNFVMIGLTLGLLMMPWEWRKAN